LESLRQAWAGRVEFRPTERAGHAEDLAFAAANEGFRIVAAAGGDGTVHEVANGLMRANKSDVTFAVVPIGSANDYAHSLEVESAGAAQHRKLVDVGVVREPSGRERHFVCCLGLGFNGLVTVESRRIHWLQGVALYGLATLRVLWRWPGCPPMTVRMDEEPETTAPTLMLSVMLARREGGFMLAPQAQLDDGLFDFVHTGNLSRLEILRLLPRLSVSGPPTNNPKVRLGRCRSIRLRSTVPLAIHVDGEFFAKPEDGVKELEIEVKPLALRAQLGLPT
jgi:diacylglycerol kinase family enzyme